MARDAPSPKTYYWVSAALGALLAATIVAAQLRLGAANLPIALSIAGAKAALIVLFFMHLRWSFPLVRAFALVGLFGLALLMSLTAADVGHRRPPEAFADPAPAPPQREVQARAP